VGELVASCAAIRRRALVLLTATRRQRSSWISPASAQWGSFCQLPQASGWCPGRSSSGRRGPLTTVPCSPWTAVGRSLLLRSGAGAVVNCALWVVACSRTRHRERTGGFAVRTPPRTSRRFAP